MIFSFLNLYFVFSFAFSTIPPSPEENEQSKFYLQIAESDFVRGDLNSAYKNLLFSSSLKNDEQWRKIYLLTLVGLDEPLTAISQLQEQKNISQKEKKIMELLLKRQGFLKEKPQFSETQKIVLPKEALKKVSSIIENDNFIFILTENSLYKIGASGNILETTVLTGGQELLLTDKGEIAILTKDSLIFQDKRVVLPLQIKSAISFAKAPAGNYYILDDNNELFMLDADGKIIQQRQLLIKKCLKIRTDNLFRVFILSSKEEVSVYSTAFEPLFVMDGNPSATKIGGIKDFFVDFAGNPIFLDKSGELFFFNFKQEFLGKSQKEKIKTDLFWWNGEDFLFSLDKRKMVVRKLEL